MRYIMILISVLLSLHTFSYAMYSWKKKNRGAAIGVILIGTISIALPALVLFIL